MYHIRERRNSSFCTKRIKIAKNQISKLKSHHCFVNLFPYTVLLRNQQRQTAERCQKTNACAAETAQAFG